MIRVCQKTALKFKFLRYLITIQRLVSTSSLLTLLKLQTEQINEHEVEMENASKHLEIVEETSTNFPKMAGVASGISSGK